MWLDKFKALLIHLGISLLIFIPILYLILFHWYPQPLFSTDGGWKGVKIMAGVDLVLGPTLTFIVYKAGKPGLKFDFTVIGIIQAAALSWGLWTVHNEHPVALVFSEYFFTPVTAVQLQTYNYDLHKLEQFGTQKPVMIYLNLPTDVLEKQRLRARSLSTGKPLFLFTEYYKKLDTENSELIRQKNFSLTTLLKNQPDKIAHYQSLLQQFDKDVILLPLHSRYRRSMAIVDLKTKTIPDSLNIEPPRAQDIEVDDFSQLKAKADN